MGRNATRPSVRVGTTIATDSSFSRPSVVVPRGERLDGAGRVGRHLLDELHGLVLQVPGELAQPGAELRPEVLPVDCEAHDRLDVVEAVAGVVAASAEHDAV